MLKQILETEILKKTEELQEHDKKADKLRANMEKDMKKMLKEIAKLRKQVEEMPGEKLGPSYVLNDNYIMECSMQANWIIRLHNNKNKHRKNSY